MAPWAMETLSRGRKSGRFGIDDLDLALTSITGAALAAIRAILAGRIPPGPKTESRGAEMMIMKTGRQRRRFPGAGIEMNFMPVRDQAASIDWS